MSPFEPWMPMYREGADPDRPWWSETDETGTRDYDVSKEPGSVPFWYVRYRRVDGAVFWAAGADVNAEMVRIDKERPLPHPGLIPTQVWAVRGQDGTWRSMTFLGQVDQSERFSTGHLNLYADAVLLGGPSPWGRDCPWAPAGYQP